MQRQVLNSGNSHPTTISQGTSLQNILGQLLRAWREWHRNARAESVKAGLSAHLQHDIGHIDRLPRHGREDAVKEAMTKAANRERLRRL